MGVGEGQARAPGMSRPPKAGASGVPRLSWKMEGLRGGAAMERAALCVFGRRLRLPRAFPTRLPSPPPPAR